MKIIARGAGLIGACAILLAAAVAAHADDFTGHVGIGPTVGAAVPLRNGDITRQNDTGLALGGWLAYGVNRHWTARMAYDNLDLQKGNGRAEFLQVGTAYNFHPDGKWNPNLHVGIGPAWLHDLGQTGRGTLFGVSGGVGVDRYVTEHVTLGLNVDWMGVFSQSSYNTDAQFLRPGVTAGYWFGAHGLRAGGK